MSVLCNTDDFYCGNLNTKGHSIFTRQFLGVLSFFEKNNTSTAAEILNKRFHDNEEVTANMCSFRKNIR